MSIARVTLKKAKTYTLGDRRWILDVPQIVRGEEDVLKYESNGHFHVKRLKGEPQPSVEETRGGRRFVKRASVSATDVA
jgi:hypothetical protein